MIKINALQVCFGFAITVCIRIAESTAHFVWSWTREFGFCFCPSLILWAF